MALEQWEVDLRKQLENTPKVKAREDWENQLDQEIKNIPSDNKQPVLGYAFIIVFLLGAVLFAYDMKTGSISNWFNNWSKSKPTALIESTPTPPKVDDSQYRTMRSEFDRLKADNQKQFADLEKRVKWNGDRITLLATVQQENFLTIRNGTNNFIYFNADWTIDRMPQYLELTPEDKSFLEKYLKKD